MKLSISNIAWDKEQDQAVYDLMHKYGYTGLEIAPSRIVQLNPYKNLRLASKWAKRLLEIEGFVIPSMQSIWYGKTENIWGTAEERKVLTQYTKDAIAFANAVKCRHMVFGCPRNRNRQKNANPSDREVVIKFFRQIGNYAAEHGVVIGLEANPKIYNTNFLNDTASAIDFIKSVDSDGITLNLDVGTIIENNEDLEVVDKNFSFVHHVHISEPYLNAIVERHDFHKELKRLLDKHDYSGFVSIEMKMGSDLGALEHTMSYVTSVFGN